MNGEYLFLKVQLTQNLIGPAFSFLFKIIYWVHKFRVFQGFPMHELFREAPVSSLLPQKKSSNYLVSSDKHTKTDKTEKNAHFIHIQQH